ncbi:hypothetical protein LWE61_04020 [Sphingobium sufflavum]|uniref:hypothetical protein n=1 Tax=Sphingobium sufflavum TaxID=1129547 RepID=UPI001F3DAC3F|nr:hypothetical protein [Sphingobium sufflavum]MCE7795721.1 hypothetical protein [Sphingobium sufflavum]
MIRYSPILAGALTLLSIAPTASAQIIGAYQGVSVTATVPISMDRLKQLGATLPLWFFNPDAPRIATDRERPTTPADRTASMQVNMAFAAGSPRALSCEVLMSQSAPDISNQLCQKMVETYRLAPERVQPRAAQAHFWVHVYSPSDGVPVEFTRTDPVFTPEKG